MDEAADVNTVSDVRPAPPRVGIGLLLALWSIPAWLMVLQMYINAMLAHRSVAPATVLPALAEWYLWVPMTPIVFRAAAFCSAGRVPMYQAVIIHVGAVAMMSVLRALLYGLSTLAIGGVPPGLLGAYVLRLSIGWLPIAAVVYGALLAGAMALMQAQRARERASAAETLQRRLAESELAVVRARFNPHFLFNALHSVGALVRAGETRIAVEAVARLGAILRDALTGTTRSQVPLHEEIAFAEQYLDIERLRLGARLRVDVTVDASALGVLVPPFCVQQLAENAVRHGVAPRTEESTVTIDARISAGVLEIRVTNPAPSEQPAEDTGGWGLSGLRAVMDAQFGVSARVDVRPGSDSTVETLVSMPVRFVEAGAASV